MLKSKRTVFDILKTLKTEKKLVDRERSPQKCRDSLHNYLRELPQSYQNIDHFTKVLQQKSLFFHEF